MTQSNPTNFTDTISGSELATELNQDNSALLSMHKGPSRPSYAVAGTQWIDDSATPWIIYMYDGSNDIKVGEIDPSGDSFTVTNAESATTATTAGDADTLDGYDSDQTATADTVAVRDASGGIAIDDLNAVSGDFSGSAPTQPDATASGESATLGQVESQASNPTGTSSGDLNYETHDVTLSQDSGTTISLDNSYSVGVPSVGVPGDSDMDNLAGGSYGYQEMNTSGGNIVSVGVHNGDNSQRDLRLVFMGVVA